MHEIAASPERWTKGIIAGDRKLLGRAITLLESSREADQDIADELLAACMSKTGGALRVAITGTPGAGKSTFIEALGLHLVKSGCSVAVLAIDPSSAITRGSILGDKTRMPKLAAEEKAYIRPSPSRVAPGGIASTTHGAMLLCEAAGYRVVLIETVGTGQSEIAVRDIVDTVVLLVLAHAGDELQGIKRGILETADIIAVSKADGAMKSAAETAVRQYRRALAMRTSSSWQPPVLACSAFTGNGVVEVWEAVELFKKEMRTQGQFVARRKMQAKAEVLRAAERMLALEFTRATTQATKLSSLQDQVARGQITARAAARMLVQEFLAR